MKRKVHICVSPYPLRRGSEISVLCGDSVEHAEFAVTIEGELHFLKDLSGMSNCKECVAAFKGEQIGYIYGVVRGDPDAAE